MGAFSGPKIVEDGLVLALDGANYKSFKGEVTTNIVPNAGTMSSWGSYGNGNDGTFTTEFGTTGYKMINRGSWNGIYKGITLPSAGTYTISAWFRYWGGASDNNGATVYTNGGGISDTAVTLNKSLIGVWQRVSMTRTYSTTGITFYLISYGGTYGGSNSTWDVTMPQIEQKSYVTNFVDGTRGSTVATGGGWADLTGNGNHGELVNGVRESSDNLGALVFDGTNDYVQSSSTTLDLSSGVTMEMIFKSTDMNSRAQGFMQFNTHPYYINFYTPGDGKLRWETWVPVSTAGGAYFTPTALLNNTWYHAVGTYTNGSSVLYINGTSVASASQTPGTYPSSFTANIKVGEYAGYMSGNIAIAKMYNRALTAQEVKQNFNALRGRFGI